MDAEPAASYPPADILRTLLGNGYFLSRICTGADLEEVLAVDDASFQAFDALFVEHGRTADSEDGEAGDDEDGDENGDEGDDEELGEDFDGGDLVMQRLAVPVYLPEGAVWEVELFDNGEDAGVVHWLRPADGKAVELATLDAHPTGPILKWRDAELVFSAIAADPRNRESHVSALAPILLWGAIGLLDADDRQSIEVRLAGAWEATGLVEDDGAATLASLLVRHRRAGWRPTKPTAPLAALLARLGA